MPRTLEDKLIRNLPEKHGYTDDDYLIIEGRDGTKKARVGTILTTYATNVLYFDTLYDLLRSTDLEEGVTVNTLGFRYKGDGGAAKYQIRNGNPYFADDTTTFQMANVIELKAFLIIEDEMYVEQFGAAVDGVTDCTNAFLAAIENCDTIKLNHKVYTLSNTIEIPRNKRLIGNGATINCSSGYGINITGNNVYIEGVNIVCETLADGINITGVDGPTTIRDCSVDVSNGRTAINIANSSYITIDTCTFKGTNDLGTAINIRDTDEESDNYNYHITIDNCVFDRCVKAIVTSAKQVLSMSVRSCAFVFNTFMNTSLAIQLDGKTELFASDNSIIKGCYFIRTMSAAESYISVHNLTAVDTQNIYSINGNKCITTISGIQKFDFNDEAILGPFIFDTLFGKLFNNVDEFIVNGYKDLNTNVVHGGLLYQKDPTLNEKIIYTISATSNTLNITTFRNITVDVTMSDAFSKLLTITKGVPGQIINLISSNDAILSKDAATLESGTDAQLHKYKGTKLLCVNEEGVYKWIQI